MNTNQKAKDSGITKIEGILSYYFIDGIIKVRTNIYDNKII
jgi:hypothetical protein